MYSYYSKLPCFGQDSQLLKFVMQFVQQKQLIMMRSFAQKSRESSSMIHGNRRYIKKGVSPDINSYIGPCIKSNQQLFSHLTPHLHAQSQQNRFTDKNVNNFTSTSKLCNREDAINYQLYGLSSSKNGIYDNQRRKGKSSFYKKINDMNSSELFFGQPKSTATKEISKMSSQEQTHSLDPNENDVQQLHYKMVDFQQKCKKMVAN